MRHRIACIGQSNSLLRDGFYNQLAASPEVEMGNAGRVGASPSTIIPFFAEPAFFAGHDFCLFDVAVVDQSFIWQGALDAFTIGQYVSYGVAAAHAAGCQPVLLVIPQEASLPLHNAHYDAPPLQQVYQAVALRQRALLVDLTPELHALGMRSPELLRAAYRDPDHLSPGYSKVVADRLVELFRGWARNPIAPPRWPEPTARIDRLKLTDLAPAHPFVSYRNSVLSGDYCVLRPGERITLDVGPVKRLLALMINRSASAGQLRIEGEGHTIKMLGTFSERDVPYVAQVVPILLPIADRDGALTLSMADPAEPPTEATWQALITDEVRGEVAELLVERP